MPAASYTALHPQAPMDTERLTTFPEMVTGPQSSARQLLSTVMYNQEACAATVYDTTLKYLCVTPHKSTNLYITAQPPQLHLSVTAVNAR